MTVMPRSKLGARTTRRPRDRRLPRLTARSESAKAPDSTRAVANQGTVAASRRREGGAPQDQAVYSCGCGFVFEAHVSTSVGCPHCGGKQAW